MFVCLDAVIKLLPPQAVHVASVVVDPAVKYSFVPHAFHQVHVAVWCIALGMNVLEGQLVHLPDSKYVNVSP